MSRKGDVIQKASRAMAPAVSRLLKEKEERIRALEADLAAARDWNVELEAEVLRHCIDEDCPMYAKVSRLPPGGREAGKEPTVPHPPPSDPLDPYPRGPTEPEHAPVGVRPAAANPQSCLIERIRALEAELAAARDLLQGLDDSERTASDTDDWPPAMLMYRIREFLSQPPGGREKE